MDIAKYWNALPALGKVCVVIGLLALYSIIFGVYEYNRGFQSASQGMKSDTVYKETIRWDTVRVDNPIPSYQYIVSHKTDTFRTYYVDTVEKIVAVDIPITSKTYQDTSYKVSISGYKPQLDSIRVYNRTITQAQTVTNTITNKKKWGVGLTAGYGYSLHSKRMEPQIGVGVQYRLF